MDQCTHEVRLQYWKNIISQCHSRPAGQSAKQWMDENGIKEQTYYNWQRKLRKAAYDSMQKNNPSLPVPTEKEKIAFAEIPVSLSNIETGTCIQPVAVKPVAVIQTTHCTIALTADVPESFLTRILQEVSHA